MTYMEIEMKREKDIRVYSKRYESILRTYIEQKKKKVEYSCIYVNESTHFVVSVNDKNCLKKKIGQPNEVHGDKR